MYYYKSEKGDDIVRLCPVDVISYCDTSGQIKPLRIRIRDEEKQYQRLQIEQIVSCQEVPYVGAEAQLFLCRTTVDGRPWLFRLKYMFREHCWYLEGRII